ncbi:MAG: penicillin acylase family protein [Planctomycetota bacterium]|jgi:penicillin amidase
MEPSTPAASRPRRRRWPRRLLWALLFLLVLGGLWTRGFLRGGLPWRSGEFAIPGLGAEVQVHFDERGVPHVQAGNFEDACAALGFLHANDRCLQLELIRSAAAGRLSEVFGSSQVGTDRRLRQLGLKETAKAWYAALGEDSRRALEAYASGINAWFEARGNDLPPHYKLLGAAPEPWTPADSLGVALLMDLRLSPPDRQEWANERVLRVLGESALRDLLFDQELQIPERLREVAARGPDAARAAQAPDPGELGGSNNWAVAGARAAGESGLLAGDPHLWLSLPAQWYLASVHGGAYRAAGATLPGMPLVIIGGSDLRAWSFTTTGLDTHDFVVEEVGAGGRLRRGGDWLAVTERNESIPVRFGDPQAVTLRRSDLGPFFPANGSQPASSLQWAARTPADPLSLFFGLASEPELERVLAGAEGYVAPVQNLMVAQADGRVGYAVVGRGPERPAGASDGWLARRAANNTWLGLRPAASNPRWIDPPEGFAVTANADVRPADYALPFPSDFAHPSRRDRALAALGSREAWTLEEVAALQLDLKSPLATELAGAIADQLEGGERAGLGERLRAWAAAGADFSDEAPAALYLRATRELALALFSDEFRALGRDVPGPRVGDRLLADLFAGRCEHDWWDTEEHQRSTLVADACFRAQLWLELRQGESDSWSVSEFMELDLDHALSELPVIGPWLSRGPFPRRGHPSTLDAHWCEWEVGPDGRDQRLLVYGGASVRYRSEPGRPERAAAGLPGGQSGHPLDAHYDDLLEGWLAGEAHALPWEAPAGTALLRLIP